MFASHEMKCFKGCKDKDSCKLSIKSKQREYNIHTVKLPSELLPLKKHKPLVVKI